MFPAHHNQARPSIDSAPLCLNAAIDTPSPYYGEAADTNSRKFWSEARIYVLCLFLVAYYHHKSAHSNAIGYRIADSGSVSSCWGRLVRRSFPKS
jgi:hypothetical protein